MSAVKSQNSSINSDQHHCVSHWRKFVYQVLPVRKEAKVPEEEEDCKAPKVKREFKASWVYLVDTANKALWEIKESKEKKAIKVRK